MAPEPLGRVLNASSKTPNSPSVAAASTSAIALAMGQHAPLTRAASHAWPLSRIRKRERVPEAFHISRSAAAREIDQIALSCSDSP